MKQKQLSYLSIFVILFMAVVIAGWFFYDQQNKSLNATISGNYDTVMKRDPIGQNKRAPTHFYTLALSWSPAFCAQQKKRNKGEIPAYLQFQCGTTQQFGWVIHGLWPQNAKAKRTADHPRFCQGDLPELPSDLIEKYLPESPTAALLQGQWEKHGACAFKDAASYFEKQKSLFHDLKLPHYDLQKADLIRWMRQNNPQLANIYLGASRHELYICYNKQWQPMNCPRTLYQ